MTPGFEFVQIAVNLLVLGVAVWIIKTSLSKTDRLHERTESVAKAQAEKFQCQLNAFEHLLHALELKLKDCMTWEEFEQKVGPLRERVEKHSEKIVKLEAQQTYCQKS